jgi:hypothetical protein
MTERGKVHGYTLPRCNYMEKLEGCVCPCVSSVKFESVWCFYFVFAFLTGVGDVDSGSGLKLPPLKLQEGKGLVVRISGGSGRHRNRRLEVENRACGSSFGPLAKVRVFSEGSNSGDVPEWEAALGYAVCGSVANSQLVAIACEDATLHILHTDTGMTFVMFFLCILGFTW